MKRICRVLLVFLAIAGLNACGGEDPPEAGADAEASALARARDQWRARGASDYVFTLSTRCFCPPESPITVVVRNDVVVDAYHVDTLERVPAGRMERLPTLPGLLAEVERAYATGAAQVDVSFDPLLGHVQTLYVDQDRRIADEEIAYRVSNLILATNGIYSVVALKYTGERQCEGGGLSVASLRAQLTAAGNEVIGTSCGWDGNAYPAVCGAATGKLGIFKLASGETPPRLPEGFVPIGQFPNVRITPCGDGGEIPG